VTDREPDKLRSHALLRRSDAFEVAGAPVVQLDEDMLHIEGPKFICSPNTARKRTGSRDKAGKFT